LLWSFGIPLTALFGLLTTAEAMPPPFTASTLAYLELAKPGAGFEKVTADDDAAGCVEELAAVEDGPAVDGEPARPDCEGMAGIGAALEVDC